MTTIIIATILFSITYTFVAFIKEATSDICRRHRQYIAQKLQRQQLIAFINSATMRQLRQLVKGNPTFKGYAQAAKRKKDLQLFILARI